VKLLAGAAAVEGGLSRNETERLGQDSGDDAVAVSGDWIADTGAACDHDAALIVDRDRAARLVAAEVDVYDAVVAEFGIELAVRTDADDEEIVVVAAIVGRAYDHDPAIGLHGQADPGLAASEIIRARTVAGEARIRLERARLVTLLAPWDHSESPIAQN